MTKPPSDDPKFSTPSTSEDKLAELELQPAGVGTGPLYHRRYLTQFDAAGTSARELILAVMADPNAFSPRVMATFEKTSGEAGRLAVGDHFMVHITGPWNGPVVVSHVEELSFTLQTLEGHMEAGRIRFSAADLSEGQLQFEIESWARSHTPVVDFLYDKIPLARAAQATMWISFCKAVAKKMGKSAATEVEVATEKWDGQTWAKL